MRSNVIPVLPRFICLPFLLCCLACAALPAYGQHKLSLPAMEDTLIALGDKMSDNYRGNYDSLLYYSNRMDQYMHDWIGNDATTISYPFEKLVKTNTCKVHTSDDGNFRIYSWDTWTGGTMTFFHNLFQYKTATAVRTMMQQSDVSDPQNFCSAIFTLKTPENKTYYLVITNGKYSTKDMSQTIQVFAIHNDALDDQVKLIKTKSGLQHAISYEYDFFGNKDRLIYPDQLIRYDKKQKIIFIPVVNEKGRITEKFIRYRFTGKYFERI